MLSHPLIEQTNKLRRSLISARLATGACWVTAVTLAAAVVLGFADYFFRYIDPGLRLLSSAALVGAAAWAVRRFLVPVWRQPVTRLGVARRIEQQFPQLNDGLASSIEFLRQSQEDPTAGSPALRRAVVAETSAAVASLPVHTIIDRRPLWRAARNSGAAVLILLVAIFVDFHAVRIAAHRLIAPLGNTQWPRRHHLQFRRLPTQHRSGQPFEVELIDAGSGGLPDEVLFHLRYRREGQLHSETEPMQRIGDLLVARREGIDRTFEFRASGGDDQQMPWHAVEVVEPPSVADIQITAHPPAYTGMPVFSLADHRRVIAGTHLELSATVDQPLRAARVGLEGGTSIQADMITDDEAAGEKQLTIPSHRWIAEESGDYWIEVENTDGLVGRSERWKLVVDDDTPPNVTWQKPRSDMFVLPGTVVPVEVVVKDNLGIQSVVLSYARVDSSDDSGDSFDIFSGLDNPPPTSPDAVNERTDIRQVTFEWDLAPLGLSAGSQLAVSVRAADYRPGWGATPSPRQITIITRDAFDQRVADALSRIARRLEESLASQRRVREQINHVELQARTAGQLADSDLDALQSAQLAQRRLNSELVEPDMGIPIHVASLIAELEANRLELSDVHRRLWGLQTALAALAEDSLPAITDNLTTAHKSVSSYLMNEPEFDGAKADSQKLGQIQDALARAGSGQERVIRTLEDVLDNLAEWAGVERFARELADLRNGQLAIFEMAEQAILQAHSDKSSEQDRADVAKLIHSQSDLSRRFETLVRDIGQAAERLASEQATMAQPLRNAAEMAHQLQTGARLREATGELREGHMGRARQLQQRIADDLAEILDALRRSRFAEEVAQHQMARLETVVKAAANRQRKLLDETRQWEDLRRVNNGLTFAQSRHVLQLAEQQTSLGEEIRGAAQSLGSMAVFRLAMNESASDMQRAADLLYDRNTSAATQESEKISLGRLQQILDALEQDRQTRQDDNGSQSGGTGGGRQPPGPQISIAELKLLRLWQADLNIRTRQNEQRLADFPTKVDENPLDYARHQAEDLAREQGRLAELVQEMFSRDNKTSADPDTEGESP